MVDQITVRVSGVDPLTGVCQVVDSVGGEHQMNIRIRKPGSGIPVVGEQWVIDRVGALLVFDSMLGATRVPEVEDVVTDLHPVEQQMLAALGEHGLVSDLSIGPEC